HLRAENVATFLDDAVDGCLEPVANSFALRAEVDELHGCLVLRVLPPLVSEIGPARKPATGGRGRAAFTRPRAGTAGLPPQSAPSTSCNPGGLAPARETVTAAAFAPSLSARRIAPSDRAAMAGLARRSYSCSEARPPALKVPPAPTVSTSCTDSGRT